MMGTITEISLIEKFLLEYKAIKSEIVRNSQNELVMHSKNVSSVMFGFGALIMLLSLFSVEVMRRLFKQKSENEKLLSEKYIIEKRFAQARKQAVETVAHDLRNPLSNVIMANDLMQSERAKASDNNSLTQELSDMIGASSLKMKTLIDGILNHSAIESDSLILEDNSIEVGHFFNELKSLFQFSAGKKRVKLYFDSAPEDELIRADREKLYQVFSNLIGNSLKFTPADGVIKVKAEKFPDEICFSVEDSGVGMSQSDVTNLFKPYWQSDKKSLDGIGLGMKIVSDIIHAHNGLINVESTEGVGTRISFTLPTRGIDGVHHLDTTNISLAKEYKKLSSGGN